MQNICPLMYQIQENTNLRFYSFHRDVAGNIHRYNCIAAAAVNTGLFLCLTFSTKTQVILATNREFNNYVSQSLKDVIKVPASCWCAHPHSQNHHNKNDLWKVAWVRCGIISSEAQVRQKKTSPMTLTTMQCVLWRGGKKHKQVTKT